MSIALFQFHIRCHSVSLLLNVSFRMDVVTDECILYLTVVEYNSRTSCVHVENWLKRRASTFANLDYKYVRRRDATLFGELSCCLF